MRQKRTVTASSREVSEWVCWARAIRGSFGPVVAGWPTFYSQSRQHTSRLLHWRGVPEVLDELAGEDCRRVYHMLRVQVVAGLHGRIGVTGPLHGAVSHVTDFEMISKRPLCRLTAYGLRAPESSPTEEAFATQG